MKNKFEVPFNFRDDGFNRAESYKDDIDCVYLPIGEREHNTREGRCKPEGDKYLDYLKRIQDLGITTSLLIQRNSSKELIEKYYDLGVKDFIIDNDELAKQIKQDYPDIFLRLSIMRGSPEDIKKDLPYDNICLPFYYNRHFEEVKELPKKNYTLLVNATCLGDCPGFKQHGFYGKTGNCSARGDKLGNLQYSKIAYIRPEDLIKGEPYIKVFKLQGRDFSSRMIFNDLDKYKNPSPK